MFDLKNKRVLVVGGSSGIGEGAAKMAAEHGAKVTIASRTEAKLKEAAQRIGRGCEYATIDTREDSFVEAFFAKAGAFDHVVMSAAQVTIKPVREFTVPEAQASMNSKFWGAYRVARSAQINDGGSLTLVSGAAAVRATKGRALQTAINAAVEALTKGLALEFAPVRVNTVSPGIVETPIWGNLDEARIAQIKQMASRTPTGRVGQPQDIAQQILVCMTNPFMTGSIVYIDGGYLL
ncbi:MAG TPA: SDR family oxidoreductase [Rhizomicrobium sp.]|nr:SDR family oxidoreductase [Rhizomicrobium sp.]